MPHDRSSKDRAKLTQREIWRLILATYRLTMPYVIGFAIALLLITWLITSLIR